MINYRQSVGVVLIYVALGSNLPSAQGGPQETLLAALGLFPSYGIDVIKVSNWYETAPVPVSDQPNYVNGVVCVKTLKTPEQLLETLHTIETEFGRVRSVTNAARCIDLDLIDYNGVIQDDNLVLPHPRMALRGFVLYPLRDIAPHWQHPILGYSIGKLIESLPIDQQICKTE